MLDGSTIAEISRQACVRAAAADLVPYAPINPEECLGWTPPFPIPNLGDYRPRGWALIEHRMANSSGLGCEDEPALTMRGFKRWCYDATKAAHQEGYQAAFGIIEAGEFQVVVGLFVDNSLAVAVAEETEEEFEFDECPHCGETIEKGDTFCYACWQDVTDYKSEED